MGDDGSKLTKPASGGRWDWIGHGRWARMLAGAGPVVMLLLLFVVTGIRGVDLGYHWDEVGYHLNPARQMVASGVLLPRAYIYPTVGKWLILLPAVPAAIRGALDAKGDPQRVQAAMLAAIDAPDYLLKVRCLYIVVSSLAILWIYGAALALGYRRWAALVAAAGVGLSWEFATHARWVVTDCILVQFSALTLFMLAIHHRTGKIRWIYGAASAAGLCTGTKYPGVFLLVPVLLASVLAPPARRMLARARRAVLLCATAFVVYLITTPGTVLDPFTFLGGTGFISNYYAHGHGGYTATSVWNHVGIVFTYLSIAYFSPYRPLAVILFAGVLVGGVLWIRTDRRFGAVLVLFPVVFLVFFCVTYRVVTVRNYLFLTPFLAILLGRGVEELDRRVRQPRVRGLLATVLTMVLLANAIWLVRAAESIRHVDPKTEVRDAIDYVKQHPGTRFRLSAQVRALMAQQQLQIPLNVTRGADAAHVVFFGHAEGPDPWDYKVNDPWLTEETFGPLEMNFNWYPTWFGHDRVVVMTMEKAKATGVPLAR
jgi:hypothetical protein